MWLLERLLRRRKRSAWAGRSRTGRDAPAAGIKVIDPRCRCGQISMETRAKKSLSCVFLLVG